MKSFRMLTRRAAVICMLRNTILATSLTLMLISTVEIVNTLYFNRGNLNSYGTGFLIGNIFLFIVSMLLSYKLAKSMHKRS
ncbi:hypothetical protein [Sphingobacterium haloxyli]|uniref:hypothetical protein n=1 Tax=Sphingobacterium haloxyli TaxID=2100533 RepID=UPI001056F15C|nr:hypothetical protein [Sphingobacterium haloxyli]